MSSAKPSIFLVFPPYSDNICFQTCPPLGINYLATLLNNYGFKAKAVDFNMLFVTTEKLLNNKQEEDEQIDFKEIFPVYKNIKDCLAKCEIDELAENLYLSSFELTNAFSYDVISFSVAFAHQLPRAVEMARIIRENNPKIKILIGGSQITLLTAAQLQILAESSLFDFIMCGYGEKSLPELLKNLHNEKNKIIKASKLSKKDFENIPATTFPSFNEYFEPRFIPVLIGYGCHWGQCSFCDYKRLSHNILLKSPGTVFDEIKNYNKLQPKGFILISDAIPNNWYLKLCRLAIKENYKLKTSGYMLHDKQLDENFFKTLEKAGVYEINFGTESLNNRILQLMNKKSDYDVIKQNLISASKYNIIISINIIADFPSITFEEVMEVADKIEEMKNLIDSLNVQYFDLSYGNDVFNNPDKFDIIINKKPTMSSHGLHCFKFKRKKPFSKKQIETIKQRYNELILAVKKRKSVNEKMKHLL